MRAAQLTKYGDSDVIEFTAEAPKPELKPGEVLIEVYAASINPFDVKLSQGLMQQMIPMAFPATLGGDFAGVVRELGDGVTGFEVGQEVFGQADSVHGNGSFAKFTPVSVNSVALKPTKLDFVAAAATPLTAVSAYEALVDTIHAQSGQKVLIHGGAGGIGSFAIQLAKHLGAHVATTASAEDSDYVRELGADEVIDYKSQQFETMLRDYDAVFDNVGGETYMNSFQILKPGGQIVSMLEQPNNELMKKYHVTATHQGTRVTTERLNAIATLIDQGALRVNVDKTFPLEETTNAFEALRGPHHGKIVLTIKD